MKSVLRLKAELVLKSDFKPTESQEPRADVGGKRPRDGKHSLKCMGPSRGVPVPTARLSAPREDQGRLSFQPTPAGLRNRCLMTRPAPVWG